MNDVPQIAMPQEFEMNVTCPACKSSVPSKLTAKTSGMQIICYGCSAVFVCELVRIRAKRSRGNRGDFGTSTRDFDVRVIDNAGERLIQFTAPGWDDFELRAKDQAIFAYQKGRLRYVHNLTIGTIYDVSPRSIGSKILTVILFAVAAIVLIAIGLAQRRHY